MSDAPRTDALRYREDLERSLTEPFSWLSLAGLFWLNEGVMTCGTSADRDIVLPPNSGPAHIGDFSLADGVVHVQLADGLQGRIDGEPITHAQLFTDHSETPSKLVVDALQFMVIERGGQLALRVWWAQHPNRLSFPGRIWYEYDARYRMAARIERFDPPRAVLIDDMIGTQREAHMDVRLHMQLDGQSIALDGQAIPDGRYYLIFKDATAGASTYPAARFLITEAPEGDTVVVDFNKAYSPPCAFTDFATCPLPIPENVLDVAIEAGERYKGMH